ncbi:MAG TPA: exonuclease domain-containing protein [Chitinophagales bacterium]|nr:exonuclease domain-containing protein [Chitinophagales bacterium]HRK28471.1 exonuclease domain-containing protein [Chitinophagales bacterium]
MYAVVDLETTGGSAKINRITEIAIYITDGSQVLNSFTSLVNPGVKIPSFITKLTGITNEMVATAPPFEEIAQQVAQITQDAVFVAHNVDFDYAFIKQEFKRLGYVFERRKLCTVNLSRKIYPGQPSYSLGAIATHFGIGIPNRHRAPDDALATTYLFHKLIQLDTQNYIQQSLDNMNIYQMLPPGLPPDVVKNLPEETGIFYFHDVSGKVIFIDKSSDIKTRILHYLQPTNSHKGKPAKIFLKTHHISYEETGSELIASLLMQAEIARLKPAHNRMAAARKDRFGIFTNTNELGYQCLQVKSITTGTNNAPPLIGFARQDYALKALQKHAADAQLCAHFCHIDPPDNKTNQQTQPCSYYHTHTCLGACLGLETPAQYNARVQKATVQWQLPTPNFFLIGEGRTNSEKSAIQVKNGRLVGYGFYEPDFVTNLTDLENCIKPITPAAAQEALKLLKAHLKKNKVDKLIKY